MLALLVAAGVSVRADAPLFLWHEEFIGPLDWASPNGDAPETLARVYSLGRDASGPLLHALHDRATSSKPRAIHFGKVFPGGGVPLEQVRALRWRWRALRHPAVAADPWIDLAASVYVVLEQPSLLHGGRGFKFGWLAKPAARGHQRGLLEVPLRDDAASPEWKSESVDLCALYRAEYREPCEGKRIQYLGVMTDADDTRSISEADYAAFELERR